MSSLKSQEVNLFLERENDTENKTGDNTKDNTKDNSKTISKLIDGVYLLILAVMGNFVAETLGCKTQKLLANSMYVKHFIIFIVIYFAIDFNDSGPPQSPEVRAKFAFVIWLLFILFTKMNLYVTGIAFAGLTSIYVLNEYVKYYEKMNDDKYKQRLINNKSMIDNLIKGLIFTIICGFSHYTFKQCREHKNNFSIYKFVFGVLKCDSLK